jgi:eukaryotic-like serine/threonine-protein kinase
VIASFMGVPNLPPTRYPDPGRRDRVARDPMTLAAGTRLGPYEILTPLGAGGMGEVYRARDSKLRRDVAIKLLPETVANDPESLARFEREARVLAALNHPGVVTIYAVEESGGTRFLAVELVEGESLDTAIAPGFSL